MIKVIASGFYSSIQDLGRYGFQHNGVPMSGSMDLYASTLANSIIGNSKEVAVLEITMTGPTLQFLCDTIICISGADISPRINNLPIKLNQAISIKKNDMLSFGRLMYGFRAYLAVKNGFQEESVMKSKSMYKGITTYNTLVNKQELSINDHSSKNESNNSIKINDYHFTTKTLEVYKGPEFHQLSEKQQNILLNLFYTVSKNHSRMAYQLEETLENTIKPIITSLVMPGTVQLTLSGKLIVLMRDCQTTGGYPRVLQLSEQAIAVLAQKHTGNQIKFRLTD